MLGDTEHFDRFARIPWKPFPGGQYFRGPYSNLESWWYGLIDAVGL